MGGLFSPESSYCFTYDDKNNFIVASQVVNKTRRFY